LAKAAGWGDWRAVERRSDEVLARIAAKAKASMLAAMPVPMPDGDDFENFLQEHAEQFYQALLPEGRLSDGKWYVGPLTIELRGPMAGWATIEMNRRFRLGANPWNALWWITDEHWP